MRAMDHGRAQSNRPSSLVMTSSTGVRNWIRQALLYAALDFCNASAPGRAIRLRNIGTGANKVEQPVDTERGEPQALAAR
jgi:hypothetical protein